MLFIPKVLGLLVFDSKISFEGIPFIHCGTVSSVNLEDTISLEPKLKTEMSNLTIL